MKMMRLLIICLFFLSACGESSTSSEAAPNDTIAETPAIVYDSVILSHDFADYPFHVENNLDYFMEKLNAADTITVDLAPNEFDNTVFDTIRNIRWKNSKVETVRNKNMEQPLISYVSISDNAIRLRNNIRIGDSVANVFETFEAPYDSTKHYRFLCLESPPESGALSVLYFFFSSDTLSRISYLPYLN